MGTQHAGAGTMNGGNPGGVDEERLVNPPTGLERALHTRLDLARRLRGERNREHLVDAGNEPAFKRMDDAAGERERLAAACTGRHRHGTHERIDAFFLSRSESHMLCPSFCA